MQPLTLPLDPPAMNRTTFDRLAQRWRDETLYLSNMQAMWDHPDHRTIVAAGPTMIPYMLDDMRLHGTFWFEALRTLSDDAVQIPPEMAGRVRAIQKAWLAWGREKGLLTA